MKPSVGRIVHYVSYGTPGGEYGRACRAAIVTEVRGDGRSGIGLAVLSPAGLFFNREVYHYEGEPLKPGESRRDMCGDREYSGGTWHWPAREPE